MSQKNKDNNRNNINPEELKEYKNHLEFLKEICHPENLGSQNNIIEKLHKKAGKNKKNVKNNPFFEKNELNNEINVKNNLKQENNERKSQENGNNLNKNQNNFNKNEIIIEKEVLINDKNLKNKNEEKFIEIKENVNEINKLLQSTPKETKDQLKNENNKENNNKKNLVHFKDFENEKIEEQCFLEEEMKNIEKIKSLNQKIKITKYVFFSEKIKNDYIITSEELFPMSLTRKI